VVAWTKTNNEQHSGYDIQRRYCCSRLARRNKVALVKMGQYGGRGQLRQDGLIDTPAQLTEAAGDGKGGFSFLPHDFTS
jgi:hypothetical protein